MWKGTGLLLSINVHSRDLPKKSSGFHPTMQIVINVLAWIANELNPKRVGRHKYPSDALESNGADGSFTRYAGLSGVHWSA